MKHVLCYGDSNTYGLAFSAEGPYRLDRDRRWTGLLQKELGPDYRIIEEGLNGRTTAYDDPLFPDRNGAVFLPVCLESHMPLDLVLLGLGTNDTKRNMGLTAEDIARGMRRLVELVRTPLPLMTFPAPRILIVAPVPLGEKALADRELTDAGSLRRSRELAGLYAALAEELGCDFFDLNTLPARELVDGIHLTEASHAAAARALAEKIRSMNV